MADVIVYFAHGITFTFASLKNPNRERLENWFDGKGDDKFKLQHDGRTYLLNRDYVCAIEYQ